MNANRYVLESLFSCGYKDGRAVVEMCSEDGRAIVKLCFEDGSRLPSAHVLRVVG